MKDGAGNVADLSGATNYNPIGTLQIDTIASTVSSIATSGPGITNGSGNLGTGQGVTLTVNMSEAVTVNTTGGSPTLTLNDGGAATFVGGSGTTALTFSYTVAAGQNTPDLVVSAFNLNGATVKDGAGNVADLSAATNYNPAGTLQISTTALTVSSIATSGTAIANGSGDLNAGQAVTLTVNFSAAVTVNTTGGSPTLTLNDGGAATFVGGSGSTALTFSYTVAAGQNTPDLVVSAFNLNGATVKDAAGNVANLSGATNNNPTGTLQIDTHCTDGDLDRDLRAGDHQWQRQFGHRPGGHADRQHERGRDRQHHRRFTDAHPQRWRHRDLCRGLGHHRADLQLHGRGGTEHAGPDRIRLQSQWRDRQGRRRQRGRPVGRYQLQSGRHAADQHDGNGNFLDRKLRHRNHQAAAAT